MEILDNIFNTQFVDSKKVESQLFHRAGGERCLGEKVGAKNGGTVVLGSQGRFKGDVPGRRILSKDVEKVRE